jgi:hypothetical protein
VRLTAQPAAAEHHLAMSALHPILGLRRRRAQAGSSVVLDVTFASDAGTRHHAIGGGPTFAEAIEFARASLPSGQPWRLVDWADVYGD